MPNTKTIRVASPIGRATTRAVAANVWFWLGVIVRVGSIAAFVYPQSSGFNLGSCWGVPAWLLACAVIGLAALCEHVWLRRVRSAEADVPVWRGVERYLPRAVRDVQADGLELPMGVHELSTLFVDLRGYSTFAEGRAPKEIFATISSYTRRASAIIRKHGGCVVEFNGDGLMALFGCPRPLANKERAAVLAALALVKAFGPANRAARRRSCEVGVGIATGEIYVGTIGWRDQAVWSATGNATILAARLQVATRSLHASIAIDARTFARAGEVGARFRKRPRLPIRGRTRPEDVFIVERPPLEAAQSSQTRMGRSGGTSRALAPTRRAAHESA